MSLCYLLSVRVEYEEQVNYATSVKTLKSKYVSNKKQLYKQNIALYRPLFENLEGWEKRE